MCYIMSIVLRYSRSDLLPLKSSTKTFSLRCNYQSTSRISHYIGKTNSCRLTGCYTTTLPDKMLLPSLLITNINHNHHRRSLLTARQAKLIAAISTKLYVAIKGVNTQGETGVGPTQVGKDKMLL